MPAKPNIDIPLDGIGGAPRAARPNIDIPLGSPQPARAALGAADITDAEFEMVNRHHSEVKEAHRRARQGG